MNKTVKGLFMVMLVFLATTIKTSGIPIDAIHWEILGITAFGTMLGYAAQSFLLPSTSVQDSFDWRDALKGGLVAVANMLSSIGASAVTGTLLDVKTLLLSVGSILLGYGIKQFSSNPTSIPPTK